MSKTAKMVVEAVELSQIVLGSNDRKTYTKIEELAADIAVNGLQSPICVRRVLVGFEVVFGHRRFLAHKHLELETIDCIVHSDLSEKEYRRLMWSENASRVQLNPIEESIAVADRLKLYDDDYKAVAHEMGRSELWCKKRHALLRLNKRTRQMVATGTILIGYAACMVGLDNNRQNIALNKLGQGAISKLSEWQTLCAGLKVQQDQAALFDMSTFMQGIADDQQEQTDSYRHLIPTRDDLPAIPYDKGTTGKLIELWMVELHKQGKADELATVGTLYVHLLMYNRTKTPPTPDSPLYALVKPEAVD